MKNLRQLWQFLKKFLFICTLVSATAILVLAAINLYDYRYEYLPYLFDRQGFQEEWDYEAGFDIGYNYPESNLESFKNSAFEKGYFVGRETRWQEAKGKLILKNPTYAQMREFLRTDLTNRRAYITHDYMCHHYSLDTVNHAKAKGIKAGYVFLDFPGEPSNTWFFGHAIICFKTIDRGLIFIEPQIDKEVKVKIGRSYFGQNHYLDFFGFSRIFSGISGLSHNDIILRIVITWADGTVQEIIKN